jgi:hypothetical protein
MDGTNVSQRTRTASSVSRTRRGLSWIPGAAALLVCLLMVLSPVTAATHIRPAVKAPYSNTSQIPTTNTLTSGCSTGNVTHAPLWSGTTGTAKLGSKSTAKNCGGYFGALDTSSSGQAIAELEIAVPVHPTSSTYLIQPTWTFKVNMTEKVAESGSCAYVTTVDSSGNGTSECYVYAYYVAVYEVYLLDTTNGTSWFGSYGYLGDNYSSYTWVDSCVYYSCTSYNYSYGGSSTSVVGTVTNVSDMYGSFVPTHKYELITYIYGYTEAQVGFDNYPVIQPSGTFAGTASSTVNLATGGNQATLKGIKLF